MPPPLPPVLLCGGGARWLCRGAALPCSEARSKSSWWWCLRLPPLLLVLACRRLPSTKKTWPSVVKSVRTMGMQGREEEEAEEAALRECCVDGPERGQKTEDCCSCGGWGGG